MTTAKKPPTKDLIYISSIKEVYGAMNNGMQIFCYDGSSWYALSFKIGMVSLIGTFTKAED